MSAKIKVLIAYDGLNPVTRITKELQRAGLPKNVEAIVLTVVDAFMPPEVSYSEQSIPESSVTYIETMRKTASDRIKKELKQAQKTAKQAAGQIKAVFPHWTVEPEGVVDSPAWGIVKKAGEWKADLVVVGSHNQPKIAKFFLGSVAQKVVTEAACPVRIVRGEPEETDSPVRIVIGVDGSPDSELAVNAVAKRLWKKGSAVHLITVVDTRMSTAVAAPNSAAGKWIKKQDRMEQDWIRRMSETYEKKLKADGLVVSTLVKGGDPKRLLVEEAERWGADCIFVGARGLNMIERFFLGSVSAAIAARAHCSVEVVRPMSKAEQMKRKKERK